MKSLTKKQKFIKKILYMLAALIEAAFFAGLTFVVYFIIADGNAVIGAVGNILLIIVFVAIARVSDLIVYKIKKRERDKPLRWYHKALKSYLAGPSFKASLYLYYAIVLIFVAMSQAGLEALQPWQGYFTSIQYGVLFLIAIDMFTRKITKDLKHEEEIEHQVECDCKEMLAKMQKCNCDVVDDPNSAVANDAENEAIVELVDPEKSNINSEQNN